MKLDLQLFAGEQNVPEVYKKITTTGGNKVQVDSAIRDGEGAKISTNYAKKSELGTAAACNTGTSSGNVPVLDSNGKLNSSVLPAIAITDTNVVATQQAMLALTAEVGDICVRSDLNKSFILTAEPASTLVNWQELLTPTDTVLSVNSKTGVVVLDADDISDSSTTNKFVTASDKTTWNAKQDALPTTSTANQVLKSTSTSGTTQWGTLSASDVGALPSNTTYLKDASVSNDTLTITKQDNTQITFQGGSVPDVDNTTIVINASSKLAAVGITDGTTPLSYSTIYNAITTEWEV